MVSIGPVIRTAYLRVYQPLEAFSKEERDQWLEAVKNRPSPKSQNLSRHDEIVQIDIAGTTPGV